MRQALIFLLALLCSTQAYVSPVTYYSFSTLRGDYQTLGGSTSLVGLQTFNYDGGSKALTYTIISNLQTVGAVELHGPAACRVPGAGVIGWNNPSSCVANSGPLLVTLGRGLSPTTTTTTTTFQAFRGTITLSSAQEEMLFNGELYVVMNSYVAGTTSNSFIETPTLRGYLGVYSQEQYNYWMYNNNLVYILLNFVANDGSFSSTGTSNSQSVGNGVLYYTLSNGAISNNQLGVNIFTTIATPGNYILVCGTVNLNLNNGNTNPNPLTTTLTLTTAQSTLFLQMMATKSCYVFITSSAFPDGDLYSWLQVPSTMDATLTGNGEATPVSSPYYARSFFYFDFGTKGLSMFTYTNLTASTITQAFVELANGTMICNATLFLNNPSNINRICYLNESHIPFINSGQVYMNIYTTNNPSGELRGQLSFTAKSSSSLGSTSAPVDGLAIGLGVGLGLVALIAIGLAVFFFMRSSGGNKGI